MNPTEDESVHYCDVNISGMMMSCRAFTIELYCLDLNRLPADDELYLAFVMVTR